jgi:transmembrane sensor
MLAADAARLGGAPELARRHLETLLARHAGDARAAPAAFTLGRLLVERLGQPALAAQAFARSQQLAPAGALAEDALAREVSCWLHAGQQQRAQERARTYLTRYPAGARRAAMESALAASP